MCSGRDWCLVSSAAAAGLPSSRSAEISGPRAHECRDDALRRADSAASEWERPPQTAKPVLIAWICVSLALFHARNSVEHSSARWLCVRIRWGRAGPYYQLIAGPIKNKFQTNRGPTDQWAICCVQASRILNLWSDQHLQSLLELLVSTTHNSTLSVPINSSIWLRIGVF